MPVVRTTLKLTNYTVTTLAVLAALATLFMWAEAALVWGDAYAYAEALTWTVVTLALFAVVAGVEWLQNRGEGR